MTPVQALFFLGARQVIDNRQNLTGHLPTLTSYSAFGSLPWSQVSLIRAYQESGGFNTQNRHYSGFIAGGLANQGVRVQWFRMDFGRPIYCEEIELQDFGAQDASGSASPGFCWTIYHGLSSARETVLDSDEDTSAASRDLLLPVNAMLRYIDVDVGTWVNTGSGRHNINAWLDCLRVKGSI